MTGYVEANVDDNGVAHYSFPDDVAWDNIEIKPTTRQIAEQIDCICFGSLAQRSRASRETILEFIGLTRPDTLKIFDLNIRQEFYSKEIVSSSLELADVLKLNDEELEIVTGLFTLSGGENERIDMLKEMFSLRGVVLTKGADGSVIHFENEKSEYTGSPVNVVDTIGAGDSFTASVAVGLLSGRSLDEINRHANLVASYVCGKKGAMVNMPGSLKY